MTNKTVVAFDLFGTILSTESIWQEISKFAGDDKAKTIAALARRYQLEYTWRSNSMGESHAFVTEARCTLVAEYTSFQVFTARLTS
jgi:2-haloacid dehalogenase